MALLHTIKTAQLTARKSRDAAASASLTTLIGEAEAIGKNNGNREVTDQEVVAITKKFIKNNRETAGVVTEADKIAALDAEHVLYSGFLPQQLSPQELELGIKNIVTELKAGGGKVDMGVVMKTLKGRFDGQYDGKLASGMIKVALA